MSWLQARRLEEFCKSQVEGIYRPHPTQWLGAVPRLVEQVVAAGRPVVALALDGIHYDVARESWSPDSLLALTSTFPSTSSVAWSTAATGVGLDVHGVPGVVWLESSDRECADRTVNCYTDQHWRPSPVPTLFENLAQTGASSLACLGDLATWSGPWQASLVRGATVAAAIDDWTGLRDEPQRVVRWVAEQVDRAMAAPVPPRLTWVFVNFDDYVHGHGYDGEIRTSLAALEVEARRWVASGSRVVAYSDHGMTAVSGVAANAARWAEAHEGIRLRAPSGGAGRTRWCYPEAEDAGTLRARLREALGGSAVVMCYDEAVALGLWPDAPRVRAQVGDVIAVGVDPSFPVVDPHLAFNHGGCSYEEMFVPFATWE